MAETVSPCRFRSWIKTISPRVITCLPLGLPGRAGGACRPPPVRGRDAHAGIDPAALRPGEFSVGTSGEDTGSPADCVTGVGRGAGEEHIRRTSEQLRTQSDQAPPPADPRRAR